MINLFKQETRGETRYDWLHSHHVFSFAHFHHPERMGFFSLRVLNEDWIAPGRGFPLHFHRDVEILTYVLEGQLENKDDQDHHALLQAGEIQVLSAGTGLQHSEFNASRSEPVHFLQVWLVPDEVGFAPRYQQQRFSEAQKQEGWCLVASPDGRNNTLSVHQDMWLHIARLPQAESLHYAFPPGRHGFFYVVSGQAWLNEHWLQAGDSVCLIDEREVMIGAQGPAEVWMFNLSGHRASH